jgi:elongin-C
LEKIVEYFYFWYRYQDREDVPDMDIPVEICLELLVAADFLGLDSKYLPFSCFKPPLPSRVTTSS